MFSPKFLLIYVNNSLDKKKDIEEKKDHEEKKTRNIDAFLNLDLIKRQKEKIKQDKIEKQQYTIHKTFYN